MSRLAKYLAGLAILATGAALVPALVAVAPWTGDSAGSETAPANQGVLPGSEAVAQEVTGRSGALADVPSAGENLTSSTAVDHIFPAGDQASTGIVDAALGTVSGRTANLTVPLFDLNAYGAADSDQSEVLIRVGGVGSGPAEALRDEIAQDPSGGHPYGDPAIASSGGNTMLFTIPPYKRVDTPTDDGIPSPVPLPGAALLGGSLIAVAGCLRAIRKA